MTDTDDPIDAAFALLEAGGAGHLIGELIVLFTMHVPPLLVQSTRALRAGDLPSVGQFAHRAYGAATMLGATTLASRLRDIEVATWAGDAERVTHALAATHLAYEEAALALRRRAEQLPERAD